MFNTGLVVARGRDRHAVNIESHPTGGFPNKLDASLSRRGSSQCGIIMTSSSAARARHPYGGNGTTSAGHAESICLSDASLQMGSARRTALQLKRHSTGGAVANVHRIPAGLAPDLGGGHTRRVSQGTTGFVLTARLERSDDCLTLVCIKKRTTGGPRGTFSMRELSVDGYFDGGDGNYT